MRNYCMWVGGVGLVAVFVLAFAGVANAAPVVTWGPATTISNDFDVSTVGTLVAAFDMVGDEGGTPPTINTVVFEDRHAGVAGSVVRNGVTFAFPGGGVHSAYNGSAAPYTGLSAAYQDLLISGLSSTTPYTVTISGLTVGQTYAFQWWTDDSRAISGRYTLATTGATSRQLDQNSTDVNGGVGQHAIGTFTPTTGNTSLTISFTAPSDWNNVSAMQLRVPEPATLALLAFGGVGMLIRRRRA